MCGIAGFIELQSTRPGEELEALNRSMASTLSHRGPDDAGSWVDPDLGLGLGHRRLSIIDLFPLGRQPLASADGRYLIVYNGEIYNFHVPGLAGVEPISLWRGKKSKSVI